jgi:hypothetical protein
MQEHNKHNLISALTIFTTLLIALPSHAETKSKAASTAAQKYNTPELIATTKRYLEVCATTYKRSKATAEMARITDALEAGQKAMSNAVTKGLSSRAAQEDFDTARTEAYIRFDVSPHLQKYKECREEGKSKVIEMIKPLGKSPQPSASAKDLTAQWLTSMDAIESNNFESERSKFETMANRLSLE